MHGSLGEVPFEVKKRFCNQFGMDVSDVKNIFKNPWSIELFTRLIWTLQIDPKTVYKWVYEHIYGNCEKKEIDFQDVIEHKFGHKKLCDLLMLLHHDQVTVANGKVVMQYIIDGDTRMPTEIAEELGLTTTVTIGQDVQDAVKEVVSANPDIVKKILDGNDRPIMSLVGKAVKATNRRGDPVVIKSLIQDAIDAKRSTHKKEDSQE
jgi:Asp-tRNA(Asn)/Glu-tRNA(Gln) amidotransferase B subunit